MVDFIDLFTHSSIRVRGERVVYFDPFRMRAEPHDADVIFITHDHSDHFSPEDIEKAAKSDTVFVVPKKLKAQAEPFIAAGRKLCAVEPAKELEICGIKVKTVASYNIRKPFHPKEAGWVGYVVLMNGERIYVPGDTDAVPEAERISCDIALVPVGGTYTMDAKEAASFVNIIRPKTVIPTHYGSVVGSRGDAELFAAKVDRGIEVSIQMLDV